MWCAAVWSVRRVCRERKKETNGRYKNEEEHLQCRIGDIYTHSTEERWN